MTAPRLAEAADFPAGRFTVLNALHVDLIECSADADVRTVARTMAEHSIHCVLVRGLERAGWGIVSDLDLMAAVRPELVDATAGELAATDPVVVQPGDTLAQAAQHMVEHQAAHAIVVEPATGDPVGILSTLDVARFVAL